MESAPETPLKPDSPDDVDATRVDDNSDDDEAASHAGNAADADAGATSAKHDDGSAVDHAPVDQDTNYSLFSNPHDLANVRQKLFHVDEPLEMSKAEFDDYFPFVDNVWRLQKGGEATGSTVKTYWCRLKGSGAPKPATPKAIIEGKQQRRKRKREDKTCQMAIKVREVSAPNTKYFIERAVGPEEHHSHDLDYMDSTKRNTAIMDVARKEAMRGFLPGSVFWKMQDEPDKMNDAGGKHMKISDVRNVQYAWRQSNQDYILKAHAGYNQQRSGPRQRPPPSPAVTAPPKQQSPPPRQPPYYSPAQPPPQSHPQPLPPPNALQYPSHARDFLEPWLPTHTPSRSRPNRPHITLTYASSLDSNIALAPGLQTAISGPETKAMTHYLRSRHDAILIGVNTALTDNPGLNCRLAGAGGFGGPPGHQQPRPIIIDPRARLPINPAARLLQAAQAGQAKGPWIVVGPGAKLDQQQVHILKAHGGEYLMVNEAHPERGLDWAGLFSIFYKEGIRSVMIEGGARVLSELLRPHHSGLIDTLIVTIAPTFFGRQGVQLSPDTTVDDRQMPVATRLTDVRWQPMGEGDVVMCARMAEPPSTNFLPSIRDITQPHTNGATMTERPPILPPPTASAQNPRP